MDDEQSITEHIEDHEYAGSLDVSHSLGIKQMPPGYALMLNPDRTHFYWLRADGAEGVICWDKWAVWRWANANKERAAGSAIIQAEQE